MKSIIDNLRYLNREKLRSLQLSYNYAKNNGGDTSSISKDIEELKDIDNKLQGLLN